jgi:hypothetical protein
VDAAVVAGNISRMKRDDDEVNIERLMKARVAIAYAMTIDGAAYGPIFERLEREIAERRGADSVMARAQACLVDYASVAAPVVGAKAIR